jgi:hypothetical protein
MAYLRSPKILPPLIRNAQASRLIEVFLISAVASLLSVRLGLHLTGYPQLGGSQIHIAHMLWGGLLMMSALLLVFTYLNNGAIRLAAILGGAGFGVFIDELGKFITRDNNYFFKPAFVFIYFIFLCLFGLYWWAKRQHHFTRQEYELNALRQTEEAALNTLDRHERQQLRYYLRQADNPGLAEGLNEVIRHSRLAHSEDVGIFAKARNWFIDVMHRGIKQGWLNKLVVSYFITHAAVTIISIIYALSDTHISQWWQDFDITNVKSIYIVGYLGSTFAALVCVVYGSITITYQRLKGLLWYKRYLLITIFVIEFFAFYKEQTIAVFGLAGNILLYIILQAVTRSVIVTDEE